MTVPTRIRPYEPSDRDAVLALAPRLTEGVAPWRDPAAVRTAVIGWVRGSIDALDADDRLLLVAEPDGRVVGFAGAAEREHWSGSADAHTRRLVVDRGVRSHRVGRALGATSPDL